MTILMSSRILAKRPPLELHIHPESILMTFLWESPLILPIFFFFAILLNSLVSKIAYFHHQMMVDLLFYSVYLLRRIEIFSRMFRVSTSTE